MEMNHRVVFETAAKEICCGRTRRRKKERKRDGSVGRYGRQECVGHTSVSMSTMINKISYCSQYVSTNKQFLPCGSHLSNNLVQQYLIPSK